MEIPWFLSIIIAIASDTKVRLATRREGSNVREMVKAMNRLMNALDLDGLHELVRQNPREAVIAANYVNKTYRYVVQSVVLEELRRPKQ